MRPNSSAVREDGGDRGGGPVDEASDRVEAPEASESFELERFEYLRAIESIALLRVAGRWHPAGPAHAASVLLVASVHGESRHFSPVPAAQRSMTGQSSFGVAFSVPLALVEEDGVRFSLSAKSGWVVELGAPTPRLLGAPLAPTPGVVGLQECRHRLRTMVADAIELERRVSELCRTIHDRAGMKSLALEALPGGKRTDVDTEPLARLVEELGRGLTRIAALEARLAELGRKLRSVGRDREEAFAERGERRS